MFRRMGRSVFLPAAIYLPGTRATGFVEGTVVRRRLVHPRARDGRSLRIVERRKRGDATDSVIRWMAPDSRQAAVAIRLRLRQNCRLICTDNGALWRVGSSGARTRTLRQPGTAIELPDGRLRM